MIGALTAGRAILGVLASKTFLIGIAVVAVFAAGCWIADTIHDLRDERDRFARDLVVKQSALDFARRTREAIRDRLIREAGKNDRLAADLEELRNADPTEDAPTAGVLLRSLDLVRLSRTGGD